MADFQITAAEVLEVLYSDSNPNLIYGIKVKPLDGTPSEDETTLSVMTAKPLNTSILRIPIKGEVVLLIKAPSSYSSGTKSNSDNYYFDIVSLQSSIHHNALPTISARKVQSGPASGDSNKYNETNSGNTKKQEEPKIDENFSENPTVKPLQPYIGDVIIEGRYGNSIRFTTTPKSGKFVVAPKWSGGPDSAPITIFRNSKQGLDTQKINDYITEDFTNNENIMVMASGQNIEFEPASGVVTAIQSKGITSWKDENWGTTPQTLISSGRLVFNSNQKEIIAFAKNGIGLSSETNIAIDAKDAVEINAAKIELGDGADEPLILGNRFKSWAEGLIDKLATLTVITPAGPSSPLSASPQWATIAAMKGEIPNLLSELSFTKKSGTTSSKGTSKVLAVPDFKMTPEDKQAVQQQADEAKNDPVAEEETPEQKATREEYISFKEDELSEEQFSHAPADDYEFDEDEIEENAMNHFSYVSDKTTDKTVQSAQGGTGVGSSSGFGGGDGGSYSGGGSGDCPADTELVKQIYNRLLQNGLDDIKARGVLANIQGETRFNPGGYKPNDNGGPSGGLCQWHDDAAKGYTRFTRMTQAVGSNWRDNPLGQVDYIFKEKGMTGIVNNYKTLPFATAEDAAQWWAKNWEVTEDTNRKRFIACFPPNLKYISYENLDSKAVGKGIDAVKFAINDIGKMEIPVKSNYGGRVKEMLNNIGINGPAFWCAAAVSTWWKSAGMQVPPVGPGLCQNWVNWAKKNNRWSSTPVVGAACLYFNSSGTHAHHIGIVAEVRNDGRVVTIEGNTTGGGFNRDGVGVFKKQPRLSSIGGFVLPA
jgi:hypothetical protein